MVTGCTRRRSRSGTATSASICTTPALEVGVPERTLVIEVTPVPDRLGNDHGVVAEGRGRNAKRRPLTDS
jgi:hypothetical protein